MFDCVCLAPGKERRQNEDLGGDGWMSVRRPERARLGPGRERPSLSSPWLQLPGQAPTLLEDYSPGIPSGFRGTWPRG